MNLLELIERSLNKPGTEPLTLAERAELSEAIRRRDAWAVFVEYHENAMWAREDAERKMEQSAYLPPEAVDYMKGEIKRRAGRKALLAAMEKNNGPTENSEATQRSDKPDGSGHAAADSRAAGEGKGAAGGTAEVPEGTPQTQTVEPDFTNGTTACDLKLAGELQAPGRGHESQSAAYQAAAEAHSPAYEQADGFCGPGESPETQG